MTETPKTVLITGASAGIGLATAKTFLDAGWNLVLNARDAVRLAEAAADLDAPDRVALVPGDVGDPSIGRRMVEAARTRFGGVDALINNAGVFSPKPFLEVEPDELDRFLRINLKGTFFTSQAAIAAMRKRGGGVVVNVGTVLAEHAIGGFPAN